MSDDCLVVGFNPAYDTSFLELLDLFMSPISKYIINAENNPIPGIVINNFYSVHIFV